MDDIIRALSEINVPTALVIFGIVLLFLGLAGKFGTYVEIRKERQNLVAVVGAVILLAGVGLYAYAALGLNDEATRVTDDDASPSGATSIRWVMAGSYGVRDSAARQQQRLLDKGINAILVNSEDYDFLCPGFHTVMVLSPNLAATGPLLEKVREVIPDAYPRNPNTFDPSTC